MALVIHSPKINRNAFKAAIASEYLGVKVEFVDNFEFGVSNKTPEFLKINPFGKVPALETPEGPLFESNAMARYVARLGDSYPLLGSSLYEKALIDQWIDVATTEIDAHLSRWLYPLLGYMPYVAEMSDFVLTYLKKALEVINSHFAKNTYLVGHSVTLADIIMFCNLLPGFQSAFTKEFLSEYPYLERYFWTMANQPNVKKYVGEVKLVEKAPTPPSKKQANPAKKPSEQHEKKSKAKAAPVQEAPPKPNEQPAAAELEEEDEKPKPKPKNPLDLLPPSSMILDDWKRLYSNTKAKDFREVAIKGFWDMLDTEGYSLWFCNYKYNEENTVTYVTMNKVSGFLQRMDLVRKYAFAKICIFGEEPPFKIKGVWLFRGQEIPKMVLDECYDAELYDWIKVDLNDEAQKEKVNAYFEEPDEYDGEKLLEAKCFK